MLAAMGALGYVRMERLVPVVLLAALGAGFAALAGLRAGNRARATRAAARVLLAGAVATVVLATLGESEGAGGINLHPLRGIAGELDNINRGIGMMNLWGNVLLFVPLGLLAPVALGWGGWRTLGASGVLSLLIEGAQLAIGRSADVDDVILNVLGAVIGVGAWLVVRWAWDARHVRLRGTLPPE